MQPDIDDLESLFGAMDDLEAGPATLNAADGSNVQDKSIDIGTFPTVPTGSLPMGSGSTKPPPPTQAESLLEEHLSLIT